LLLGTVSSDDYGRNLAAGARLDVPRRVLQGNQPALSDPSGRAVLLEPVGDEKPQIAAQSAPLTQLGLCRLQIDGRSYPISVAFPASESDLAHVDGAAIKKALGDANMQQSQNELPSDYAIATDKGDFGWPLLLLALFILAGESFLAMWFRWQPARNGSQYRRAAKEEPPKQDFQTDDLERGAERQPSPQVFPSAPLSNSFPTNLSFSSQSRRRATWRTVQQP
jgi:hypothetical protein